jgi:hypothetical protein
LVGGAVVVTSVLGALGVVGAGDQGLLRGEHFDAKQITVRPAGADGVRISEVVDIDFGVQERRGYQRIVPNDFGAPIDVTASSPDANDDLNVVDFGVDTRLRIGDPSVTFTGQHRYVLDYTLPDARVSSGALALDIIGTDEAFDTDRFEVILAGFGIETAEAVRCDVGGFGDFGGCEFGEVGADEFRTVIEPLEAGRGLTVYAPIGDIASVELGPRPPLPERRPSGFPAVGLSQLLIGAVTAGGIFAWFRRRGSNEVFGAGGAADAAFFPTPNVPSGVATVSHEMPVPAQGDWVADVPTYRVPDSRLAELATIEFVPPRGVEPWQGNLLLRENVSDQAVSAWFSEMVARGAIEIRGKDKQMTMHPGQTDARLSAVDRGHLSALFRSSPVVELGTYDPSFAAVWKGIRGEQQRFIKESGWWAQPVAAANGGSSASAALFTALAGFGVVAAIGLGIWASIAFGLLGTIGGALVLAIVVALVVSSLAYASMLASRTATGSALTLRTESFRRFLEASEGRHVDWAWEQGVIREYSAWAVALGAADAWAKAIESSNIDQPDRFTTPLLLHTYASTMTSSHTAPSSSGGSGGGGGVGGGGGGGSSGSW